jgi:hypothetical protein
MGGEENFGFSYNLRRVEHDNKTLLRYSDNAVTFWRYCITLYDVEKSYRYGHKEAIIASDSYFSSKI